jgi:transcriptional regulator with PAS, ATPase and Fis domain/tetratricopeptide (TPR) repeat protein
LIALNNGYSSDAVTRFKRAISLAHEIQDFERKCWFQLRLLVTVADLAGPDKPAPVLAELRSTATKLGLRHISAGLHIMVGEMEAKRGLLASAEWHNNLGFDLLGESENLWLRIVGENTRVALAIMHSDLPAGFSHARQSLALAEESGAASMLRAAYGNYGNLMMAAGEFDGAAEQFEKAIAAMPSPGDNYYGGLDGLARARLHQGLLNQCEELLVRIDESVQKRSDQTQYSRRYSQLTRTQLLARQKRFADALKCCKSLVELSKEADDQRLGQIALLTKAELFQQMGNNQACMETLDQVVPSLAQQPPDLHAQYERILACALAAGGDHLAAAPHLARARRIYESIRGAPGLLELSRRWNETLAAARFSPPDDDAGESRGHAAGTTNGEDGAPDTRMSSTEPERPHRGITGSPNTGRETERWSSDDQGDLDSNTAVTPNADLASTGRDAANPRAYAAESAPHAHVHADSRPPRQRRVQPDSAVSDTRIGSHAQRLRRNSSHADERHVGRTSSAGGHDEVFHSSEADPRMRAEDWPDHDEPALRAGLAVQPDAHTPGRLSRRQTANAPASPAPPRVPVLARDVLQTVAGLLRHHSRPEFLARELVHLLTATDAVAKARALSLGSGEPQVLAAAIGPGSPAIDTVEQHVAIGLARERAVELELFVRGDASAQATVNAVASLLTTIQDLERARAEREERISLWPADEDGDDAGHAVVNGSMRELMASARRIGQTSASVLITGESGTGKEIIARTVHRCSDRAARPFIPFNCTAVPRDMLESHLFGHRRGSFTGADRDHPGLIGAARDGTLFLDEIGELNLDLQPKLLRFLESNEVCPIGESTPFTISVRIIAATNADLERQVKDGRFRADLFYRLNVIRLRIPPLRERRDEIPALVRRFVVEASEEFRKSNVRVSEEAMEHFLLCRWPGNIRQLQNEIRGMVALAESNGVLTPADLSQDVFNQRLAASPAPGDSEMVVGLKEKLPRAVSKVEREMIRLALKDYKSDLDAVARALGISRKGLYLKRQRLGL